MTPLLTPAASAPMPSLPVADLGSLNLDDLRCPETGGPLSLDADGDTLVNQNGRRYGRIDGIRSFWTGPTHDLQVHYDRSASAADFSARTVNYLSEEVFERLRSIFRHFMPRPVAGLRCLDVGCGHGAFSREWASESEMIGLDFSIAMLRMAHEMGLKVCHGDATRLPFRERLFDVVICASVVQVVDDRQRLLTELVRVTKPGGLVLVSALNGDALIRRVFRALMRARIYRPQGIPASTFPALLPASTVPDRIEHLPCRIEKVAATMHPLPGVRYRPSLPGLGRLLADSFVFKIRRLESAAP